MTHKDIQHVRKMELYTNIALYYVLALLLFSFALYFHFESIVVTSKGEWMKININGNLLTKGMMFQIISIFLFVMGNALYEFKRRKL